MITVAHFKSRYARTPFKASPLSFVGYRMCFGYDHCSENIWSLLSEDLSGM